MSLIQFLRILWVHRLLTVCITGGCMLGAFIVLLIVPPSYQASSRVLLNVLKPDPVTGEVIDSKSSRTYIATQIELIKDFGVANRAVDSLGWLSDPNMIRQYQSSGDTSGNFQRWLAQKIINGTSVTVVPQTNILSISYRARSAAEAKAMADALRNAYIDASLQTRREESSRAASWYEEQAGKLRTQLLAADEAKTAYERETGIVIQPDSSDIDTARLRALAGVGVGPAITAPPPTAANEIPPGTAQLMQIDAQLAQLSKTLGPNHPQMVELRARRSLVVQLADQEKQARQSQVGQMAAMAAANAQAVERAVAAQTSRVIGKRDKIERLNQLQADVNIKRNQYNRAMERAAELRQSAAVADIGISVLGIAALPQKPDFPDKPLIMGGATGFGLAMGLAISVLVELLGRRVRGPDDLAGSINIPLLGVVQGGGDRFQERRPGFGGRFSWRPGKAVGT